MFKGSRHAPRAVTNSKIQMAYAHLALIRLDKCKRRNELRDYERPFSYINVYGAPANLLTNPLGFQRQPLTVAARHLSRRF